jgi:hypothetical protein
MYRNLYLFIFNVFICLSATREGLSDDQANERLEKVKKKNLILFNSSSDLFFLYSVWT